MSFQRSVPLLHMHQKECDFGTVTISIVRGASGLLQ